MVRARPVASFPGRVVVLGFGSVGQGMLPLLLDALALKTSQVTIIDARADETGEAAALDVRLLEQRITPDNLRDVLAPLLREGDLLLNLSIEVASLALVSFCHPRGVLYLDACIEPWAGHYDDPALSATVRSNYGLREEMLAFGRAHPSGPTACITQGANPGLVSSFAKVALLRMAADTGLQCGMPAAREDWGRLAQALGVRVIHVAERDTQVAARRKQPGEFINTWSVDAFADEALQPSELGWGTHERHWPPDALRHGYGSDAAIMLTRPGAATRVRSWTPLQGAYQGFLVTHGESISLADYLTLREGDAVTYRPTVHYAYHPSDDTVLSLHEWAGREWHLQERQRIVRDDIASGMDELGVLVMGHPRGVYWYGSRLTIAQARERVAFNSATSLQVVAGILGAIAWMLRNPRAGVVEPEELDHAPVMQVASPYLGELVGVWGDWSPLQGRRGLFPEQVEAGDPWQFVNFRVS